MKKVLIKVLLAITIIALTVGAYLGLCAIIPPLNFLAYSFIGFCFGMVANIILYKYVYYGL